MSERRIGIIGLGFMGRTHLAAYRAAAQQHGCRVVAVMDPYAGESRAGGNFNTGGEQVDLSGVTIYKDAGAFYREAQVDAVSICTPTDTHVELATTALARGLHVLLEKPVALRAADVRAVASAATAAGRVCMPAMVMRFWPGWAWLRDRIRDGTYGRLKTLTLERLGSRPAWNPGFYGDDSKSGGALVDLHIHDADFVQWCFGRPTAVSSTGSTEQVATIYRFAEGPGKGAAIVACGGWAQQSTLGFRMKYLANFERATVEFDLARGEKPVLVSDASGTNAVEVGTLGGYEAEVRHFLDVIDRKAAARADLDEAAEVAELLARELRSVKEGREA